MYARGESGHRRCFFFFKQKTAYEIDQCDWSSDVCSSDLACALCRGGCECRSLRHALSQLGAFSPGCPGDPDRIWALCYLVRVITPQPQAFPAKPALGQMVYSIGLKDHGIRKDYALKPIPKSVVSATANGSGNSARTAKIPEKNNDRIRQEKHLGDPSCWLCAFDNRRHCLFVGQRQP